MVINFPTDITSRNEKIKSLKDKKSKINSKANQNQNQNQTNVQASLNPKPTNKFTITVANISELSNNVERMDDTLKYVTDCIYDFSVSLEKFRKSLLLIFFVSLVYFPLYYFLTSM